MLLDPDDELNDPDTISFDDLESDAELDFNRETLREWYADDGLYEGDYEEDEFDEDEE